jgi:putative NADH-flavin reductase
LNLTVFGSTGRTGGHVLAEGLRRGHEITAFTRRPQMLADAVRLAKVVPGDGRDPHAVRQAITDADAVIAIVSPSGRSGPYHTAAVAEVLTAQMTDLGVRRLVVTSAYPIVGDKPHLPMALLRRVFAAAYADAARMEQIVSASELDWTIVRLNRLTDRPAHGTVRISQDLFHKPSAMSRADAAVMLLNVVEDAATIRTAINTAGG